MDISIYRLRVRDILTLCVLGLILLGIIMVQSASTTVTGQAIWQWSPRGSKHLTFAAVSLLTFFLVGMIDYARLGKRPSNWKKSIVIWMFAAALFANLIVLVPHVGVAVNGARRWL